MHTLNLARVGLLLRHQTLLHWRKSYGFLVVAFAVLLVSALLSNDPDASSDDAQFFNLWYGLLLLMGGFFVAMGSLPENKTADGRQSYLTLPASDTEKFVGSWLFTGPIFLVVFTAAFWLVSVLINVLLSLFGMGPLLLFNPFTYSAFLIASGFLLIVHPIGFLGAVTFNTGAIPKTIGIVFAVLTALGLVAALAFRVTFHEYFDGLFAPSGDVEFHGQNPFAFDPTEGLGRLVEVAFALLLLTAAYFRFHEKEV